MGLNKKDFLNGSDPSMKTLRRMLCLIDGEHYFPVTKSALDMLDSLEHYEIVAAVFIGGTEKLRDSSED